MIRLSFTHAELAALSCACVWADGKHVHPPLQKAREKIRNALDHPLDYPDEGERYANME